MSKRLIAPELQEKARIVEAPAHIGAIAERTPTQVDRSFEMPNGLYAVSMGLFLAFLAVMWMGFGNPALVIPMAIFAIFIVGFYGLPAVWTHMKPNHGQEPMTMGLFARDGIMTETGRLNAEEATVQMLILPVLILFWGFAVVTIAALV